MAEAGLTPVAMGQSVGYQEASFTLLCRTLDKYPFVKEGLNPAIADYYKSLPGPYPVDENGDWQPHWIFTGDIVETFGSPDGL